MNIFCSSVCRPTVGQTETKIKKPQKYELIMSRWCKSQNAPEGIVCLYRLSFGQEVPVIPTNIYTHEFNFWILPLSKNMRCTPPA